MSWLHQPLRPDGTRPLAPPQVACDTCYRSLLATEAEVVPAVSAYSSAFTATHQCKACRPAAVLRTRKHLDQSGSHELATLVAVLERYGVPIAGVWAQPVSVVRIALRYVMDKICVGEIRIAVPTDTEPCHGAA